MSQLAAVKETLGKILHLCLEDAIPLYEPVRKSIFQQDAAGLQFNLRRLELILSEINHEEGRLLALLTQGEEKPATFSLRSGWLLFLKRQDAAEQTILYASWQQVRATLSLLHARLNAIHLSVDLRRHMLAEFISTIQNDEEHGSYNQTGKLARQAGGLMVNQKI